MANGTDDKMITVRTAWFRDLLPLAMLVLSGLVWGMKLEARLDRNSERIEDARREIAALHAEISTGILPITRERLDSINGRLIAIERKLSRQKDEADEN